MCSYHVPDALFKPFFEFSSIHPAFAESITYSIREPFKISLAVAQSLPFRFANENSYAVFEAKREAKCDTYRAL